MRGDVKTPRLLAQEKDREAADNFVVNKCQNIRELIAISSFRCFVVCKTRLTNGMSM